MPRKEVIGDAIQDGGGINRILTGDCREVLRSLPDASVHCCVTSPPYFGLRDYGTAKWEGGDPACVHTGVARRCDNPGRNDKQSTQKGSSSDKVSRDCLYCGARRIDSQIGLEQTPDAYVAELVAVFREVRRVLRPDATLWLNIGDSYAANGAPGLNVSNPSGTFHGGHKDAHERRPKTVPAGLKPKDLIGIPWRVAFALQADGWWLRSDIIWHKPNPMPESVTDRPTSAHEHVFLFAKSQTYYFNAEAVKVAASSAGRVPGGNLKLDASRNDADRDMTIPVAAARNIHNVWTVATQPYADAHFATFPPALIEPCIKAGTSERGCCRECGAPWVRRVTVSSRPNWEGDGQKHDGTYYRPNPGGGVGNDKRERSIGDWEPSCRCRIPGLIDATAWTPKPCTVLDPFGGAGTTGLVADRLSRNAILIELNPTYAEMARRRIAQDGGLFAQIDITADHYRTAAE